MATVKHFSGTTQVFHVAGMPNAAFESAFPGVVGLGIVGAMLSGWVLFYLWKWFMVPFGLPMLSLPWAIGVSLIVSFLTNHNTPKDEDKGKVFENIVYFFLKPLVALMVGWVVSHYMPVS